MSQQLKTKRAIKKKKKQVTIWSTALFKLKFFALLLQSVRAISEEFTELGLPNYPSGIPFTFWEQYIWLGEHLMTAVGIVLAASFVVMAVILCNVWVAMFIVSLVWNLNLCILLSYQNNVGVLVILRVIPEKLINGYVTVCCISTT